MYLGDLFQNDSWEQYSTSTARRTIFNLVEVTDQYNNYEIYVDCINPIEANFLNSYRNNIISLLNVRVCILFIC